MKTPSCLYGMRSRPPRNKRFDVKFEARFRSLNKRQRKIMWCETRAEMFIDTRVNIRRGARNIVSPPLLPPPGNWNTGDSSSVVVVVAPRG